MTKQELQEKIDEGWWLELWLQPTKKYDKLTFKVRITDGCKLIFVNYHHVKSALTKDQIQAKELYDYIKTLQFNDLVNLNVRKNKGDLNEEDKKILTMHRHIKQIIPIELK